MASVIDRYGVMGYPVSHSRSPVIHRLFALQTNQNIQYELLQVTPDKLDTAVAQFQRTGGKGLNITVPHKTEVLRLVDQLSARAHVAGAVNTLLFQDSSVFGDNTDGIGLMRDLVGNLGLNLRDSHVLILGAGGATRGIVAPLLEARPASLTIANRTLSKARDLAEQFASAGAVIACRFREIPESTRYSLIINATSAGLTGEAPPYPASAISDGCVCYDLSYGLTPTPFSRWAAKHGAARSVMGWGMLVEQAAESFHLWRGIRPNTATVLKQLSISAS
ncbi:MAG TPA: shikimate dehydrogenase [Woeseiaceae bacterium]